MSKSQLRSIYSNHRITTTKFDTDYEYLNNSISIIDDLWLTNFKKFESIKLIIIGEAPLWGKGKIENRAYIYNEKYDPPQRPISFFTKNHYNFHYSPPVKNKIQLLDALSKKGILFLDVLPYPLNENITAISYRNPKTGKSKQIEAKEYDNLIKSSCNQHLTPKLKMINRILDNKSEVRWIYRYKRVELHHETISKYCKNVINSFPTTSIRISKQGGGINHNLLKTMLPMT